jgi:hypothetical protein
MKRKREGDLTEEEIAFLKSDRSAPAVRQFTSRQHESIGTRTSAYQKIAAAAKAEREALVEVAALSVIREAALTGDGAKRVAELEAERARLVNEIENVRERLMVATAAPALAIHGEGTGR